MNTGFESLSAEFWKQFGQGREAAFATAADGRVTNRMIVVVPCDGKLYMMTSRESTKYGQIQKNPNVGLCSGILQIVGSARPLGHPLDVSNKKGAAAFKAAFEKEFDEYSAAPDYEFVEIVPQSAVFYIEDGEDAGGYTLDFEGRSGKRI